MTKHNSKNFEHLSFFQLAAIYKLTPHESNCLTILSKSPNRDDENVVALLDLLGEQASGVGQAILGFDVDNARDRKLAEFFLRSQGRRPNGIRMSKADYSQEEKEGQTIKVLGIIE